MREKLIDLILGWGGLSNCAEEMADYFIENGVTIVTDNNVGKWIPVTERLPYAADDVLLYFGKEGKNQAAGFMLWDGEDQTWHTYSDDGYYTDCESAPTHWRPLPEPPKGE